MSTRIPMVGLCIAEWRKAKGRGLAYAVLLFGALHGLLGPSLLKGLELLNEKTVGKDIDPFDFLAGADAALTMAAFPVNGFALLLLASILWAEDFSLGTMAMVLVRPVHRWRVFVAKVLVVWGVGLASLALATLIGSALGLVLFGTTFDVASAAGMPFSGWMAEVDGIGERGLRIVGGLAAATLLLGPSFLLASLVANLTRSPVMTLFGSIFVLVADFFVFLLGKAWAGAKLSGGELAGKVSEYTIWAGRDLFTRHVADEPWADIWMPLVPTLGATLVFGALALLLFVRRDVT